MKDKKTDLVKIIFYAGMGMGVLSVFLYSYFTGDAPFSQIVFNRADAMFFDFWQCVQNNQGTDPYLQNSCYPAIANLFFKWIASMVPSSSPVIYTEPIQPLNQMLFVVYNIIMVCILSYSISQYKAGKQAEKILFTMLMLLSGPFIFMFERGNIIIIALVLAFIFVEGKDSENKWVREFAYVALAISAALKIYPAIFGTLLIFEKRYKEAARCIIYGILFFFLPFFVFQGVGSMIRMVNNIKFSNEFFDQATGLGYRINLTSSIKVIFGMLGLTISEGMQKIMSIIPYVYFMVIMLACFLHNQKWKRTALLCSGIILIPGYCYVYSLIFFMIPLITFLDFKGKRTWLDYFYMICFLMMLIPIPFNIPSLFTNVQTGFPYIFSTFIEAVAVTCMGFVLIIEALIYGTCKLLKRTDKKIMAVS